MLQAPTGDQTQYIEEAGPVSPPLPAIGNCELEIDQQDPGTTYKKFNQLDSSLVHSITTHSGKPCGGWEGRRAESRWEV